MPPLCLVLSPGFPSARAGCPVQAVKPSVAILGHCSGSSLWLALRCCPAGRGTEVLFMPPAHVLQVLPRPGLSLGGLACNVTLVFLSQPTAFASSGEVWDLVLAEFKGGGVERCFYSTFLPLHILGWLGTCLDPDFN